MGKSLYTSNVIRQVSENITKDGMKNIFLPPTTKYEIMHWYVTLGHIINCIFILEMILMILAKFINIGIFQEITKWVI